MQDATASPAQPTTPAVATSGAPTPITASPVASRGTLLGLALGLGVIGDLLFFKQAEGINVPIFTVLLVGSLLVAFRVEPAAPMLRRNLWLIIPTLFFALMTCLRAEGGLTFMNAVATLLLLGVLTMTLGTNRLERLTVMAYPTVTMMLWIFSCVRAVPLLQWGMRRFSARRDRLHTAWRVALGLCLAGPFLLVFIALFSAADAIFAEGVKAVLNLEFLKHLPDLFQHGMWIFLSAWIFGGALVFALERAYRADQSHGLEVPTGPLFRIGFIESATVLATVNALFLVFVSIQFSYLFGGMTVVDSTSLTFAEYARRGFFELCAVAVITMGLLLGMDWLARRDEPRQVLAFKALCYGLIVLVLVIIGSATAKMGLYEYIYGFTSLRVYTHWFMFWMAAVFLIKAGAIWWDRGQLFAFGGLLSLIISLAGFNLLNPDAFIAEQNIQRYLATGAFGEPRTSDPVDRRRSTALDTGHITSLGYDATPVIVANLDHLREPELSQVATVLHRQLRSLESDQARRGWQAFHPARWQAHRALLSKKELLERYPVGRSS